MSVDFYCATVDVNKLIEVWPDKRDFYIGTKFDSHDFPYEVRFDDEGYKKAVFEAVQKAECEMFKGKIQEIEGWLENPEWPHFGPGIGQGPLDPGRMAARTAVLQVLDALK